MSTLFYGAELGFSEVAKLAYYPDLISALVDPLGPYTQVDLADGVPNDWELGVAFLPGMDEVRVGTARLDLRGLRVRTPAEGFSCVPHDQGFKVILAQPARLVALAFDPPVANPPLAAGQTLRLMLSPADPAGPPAFIDPPFALGPAYKAIGSPVTQRTEGGRVVAEIEATFGTSWLLQWGVGGDATELTPVGVTTTVRAVTIERAVADVSLELRPDEAGGDPVLVWNHPGVLDPATGLQPVDISPIARKRLADRLAAANAAAVPPPTLTLPLRLTAAAGGPVGVSGTDVQVDYAVDAVAGGAALILRGEPVPLALTVPAALRPASGTLTIDARHLGRALNGPVDPVAPAGGPGTLVTVGHWAATALPVAPVDGAGNGAGSVTLAAVTVDVATDAAAELAVEVRADVHGLPGPVLAGAVVRFDAAVARATRELLLDPPPEVAAGSVVWVAARATTGAVRWYADPAGDHPARSGVTPPALRLTTDEGATWAPPDGTLGGATVPRARLLHRLDPPYPPPALTISSGDTPLATVALAAAGGVPDEFAVADDALPATLADLAGRTAGSGPTTVTVHVSTAAALDVRIGRVDLVYPPTAGPTGD